MSRLPLPQSPETPESWRQSPDTRKSAKTLFVWLAIAAAIAAIFPNALFLAFSFAVVFVFPIWLGCHLYRARRVQLIADGILKAHAELEKEKGNDQHF